MKSYVRYHKYRAKGSETLDAMVARMDKGAELTKNLGLVQKAYLWMPANNVLEIYESPDYDPVAIHTIKVASLGSASADLRRAFTEAELLKMIDEIPFEDN